MQFLKDGVQTVHLIFKDLYFVPTYEKCPNLTSSTYVFVLISKPKFIGLTFLQLCNFATKTGVLDPGFLYSVG